VADAVGDAVCDAEVCDAEVCDAEVCDAEVCDAQASPDISNFCLDPYETSFPHLQIKSLSSFSTTTVKRRVSLEIGIQSSLLAV
jgi:hypothetical protein